MAVRDPWPSSGGRVSARVIGRRLVSDETGLVRELIAIISADESRVQRRGASAIAQGGEVDAGG